MQKPIKEEFTFNGVLMQPHYDYAVKAWEKLQKIESSTISSAIHYGIELSQTGKVKEGFPEKIVDDIVNTATKKFIDNLENK